MSHNESQWQREDIGLTENQDDTELGEEGSTETVVENKVTICLDLEQENIQQNYDIIKLHILVQNTFALHLHISQFSYWALLIKTEALIRRYTYSHDTDSTDKQLTHCESWMAPPAVNCLYRATSFSWPHSTHTAAQQPSCFIEGGF